MVCEARDISTIEFLLENLRRGMRDEVPGP